VCFLGYSPKYKGYRCYDPSSRRIHISRDVTFVEDRPFFYNPSTQPSYSPIDSTIFLCLPPLSSNDDVTTTFLSVAAIPSHPISITPPSHVIAPPPPPHSFSKPPITHVFHRHPKTSTALPSSYCTLASHDEHVVDASDNTTTESRTISDELQVGP
jgi:hypothetical protein